MEDKALLSKFLNEPCANKVNEWLGNHQAILRITKPRASKLGDYRPPHIGKPHRISINENLSPLEFQITLVHELAHLACWEKHGRKARAHGPEWKNEFSKLLPFFFNMNEFPNDVLEVLTYFFQPGISYRAGNEKLKHVLIKYSNRSPDDTVGEVNTGSVFYYRTRKFRKIRKVRKRIECICLNNNRLYSFSPLVQVIPENHTGVRWIEYI